MKVGKMNLLFKGCDFQVPVGKWLVIYKPWSERQFGRGPTLHNLGDENDHQVGRNVWGIWMDFGSSAKDTPTEVKV